MSAAPDGTLFVGGLFGDIVKFTPDSTEPKVVVAQAAKPIIVPGILIDDSTKTLLVCGNIFTAANYHAGIGESQVPAANGSNASAWRSIGRAS